MKLVIYIFSDLCLSVLFAILYGYVDSAQISAGWLPYKLCCVCCMYKSTNENLYILLYNEYNITKKNPPTQQFEYCNIYWKIIILLLFFGNINCLRVIIPIRYIISVHVCSRAVDILNLVKVLLNHRNDVINIVNFILVIYFSIWMCFRRTSSIGL